MHEPKDWLRQAQDDWLYAEAGMKSGFFAQCCFISQQSAEKALKAVLYAQGATLVLGHSIGKLCAQLGIGDLKHASSVLDLIYQPGRELTNVR